MITASADHPLMTAHTTPLELDHQAFVTSLAHQARWIVSLRLLDTGAARDVSGVLRIAKGSEMEPVEEIGGDGNQAEEKELLYFVGGDGGVKVFERVA